MKLLLVVLLFTHFFSSIAQVERGYLLRCYNSNSIDDSLDDLTFSYLLPSDSFLRQEYDTLEIERRNEGFDVFFSEQLLRFFQFNAYLLIVAPNRRHIESKTCKLDKPIVLNKGINSNALKIILKIDDDYFFKIRVDKVQVSFCKMLRYSDYQAMFKEVIVLNQMPVFYKFLEWEKEKIIEVFSKIIFQ